MRKILFPALLLSAVCAAPVSAQQETSQHPAAQVRLPKDTPVAIRTDYGVSSKAARVDDPIYMKVAKAVSYKGMVVIPEDAPVKGRISEVTPPGGFGKTGSVVIVAEYVTVGEDRIRLSGSTEDHGKPGGASATDGVLTIPLGKGKHVNIEAGTVFIAYTEQNY